MDQTILDDELDDEPFEDWVEEWWENGGKQWWDASIKGRAPGPFQVWIQGWREGRVEGVREILLIAGTQRLGPPDARINQALEAITDYTRIREIAHRLLDVETWDELPNDK
jgi:hypothetical protein